MEIVRLVAQGEKALPKQRVSSMCILPLFLG